MDLSDIGEFGFIDRIKQLITYSPGPLTTGIGDDTAVLRLDGSAPLLLSADAMVEGRHFHTHWLSPRQIGWRAATAALSDIAAMGGQALTLLCTLCIDPGWDVEDAEELFRGIQALAERFETGLAGGDIVAAPGRLTVDITAVGRAQANPIWYRSGARTGDTLFVTGCLGDPAAAIALLSSPDAISIDCYPRLFAKLAQPNPRLDVAAALAQTPGVHAAIDISDGLIQDAGHVAEASGVAMRIQATEIPVSEQLLACARLLRVDPLTWAASGGEDFELLLAVDENEAQQVHDNALQHGIALAGIGDVVVGEGVTLLDEDGDAMETQVGGWDHFSR